MKNKIFSVLVISSLLASCARVESPTSITAAPEDVTPLEQFDVSDFRGAKQRVMVYPWNISKIDLEKYPVLRDNRIGFGVSNRLTDILFDINRFEFIEEKQEIAKRLVAQMQLCKTPDVCEGGMKKLHLKTADYIIYPEVYHFGIEKQTDITGVDTTNRQYVEIGIQITIVNAHTAAIESVGSYIGQKVLTSQGDIFNNPRIDFSQSALGKATDAAIKGAIAKALKRFDRIAVTLPSKPPRTTSSILAANEEVVETSLRSSDKTKKSTLILGNNHPLSIPVNSSQKRLALVIGNAKYQMPGVSLDNAGNDAEDISKALQRLGFDVSLYLNQSKQGMEQAIETFGQKLKSEGKNSVALFYYAGHAAEVEGVNYMFPVDVQLKGEAQVDKEAVPVQSVVGQIQMVGNDLNILVLDACRDNPYPVKKRSFNSQYNRLSTMNAPKGTIISYSTASGKTASDGIGQNGLYTGELLRNIFIPSLKVEDVFKRVRIAVSEQSHNSQIAWENSSLVGDFYFIPPRQ